MEMNEIKYGFKLIKNKYLENMKSTFYEFEHLISGARLVYVENEDTNCVFNIGFKTPPKDNSGVCHIIEHSVLCGSDKYPLKEPFVNLLKGSMSTFLNAFTSSDMTMYPVASQTPKDFFNLVSVYLDAVFNPLLLKDKRPFLQEGWHLELSDKDSLPSYKGVVYNEMKGAMSSSNEIVSNAISQAFFKDSTYMFNYGGDPKEIPNLSYEDYRNFYIEHYVPQNSLCFLYGKLDLEYYLSFIDSEYFSKYKKTSKSFDIVLPIPSLTLDYEEEYEIGKDEKLEDNTFMSMTYKVCQYQNKKESLAMQVIVSSLFQIDDGPIKKPLLENKIAKDVNVVLDRDSAICNLNIILLKSNKHKKGQFIDIFNDSVKKILENKIDKKQLIASLNKLEFVIKEMNYTSIPKGLIYSLDMMSYFNHKLPLEASFEYSYYFQELRKEIETDYFDNLLRRVIFENNHYAFVTVKPSKTLGQRNDKLLSDKMIKIKNSLSKEETNLLIKQTKELLKYQNHIDSKKELEKLPKLDVKDISLDINYLDSIKEKNLKLKTISHSLLTNQIAYLNLYFDSSCLSLDELPYLTILLSLLLDVPTKNYTRTELDTLIKTNLGNISFSSNHTLDNNHQEHNYMTVKISSLNQNIDYMPLIFNEVINNSIFTKKKIKQNLSQILLSMRDDMLSSGLSVAAVYARSPFYAPSFYLRHESIGIEAYRFLKNLLDNIDHLDIKSKLKSISRRIFSKKNAFLSISSDEEGLVSLRKAVDNLKLSNIKPVHLLKAVNISPLKNALVIPSQVNANVEAYSYAKANFTYSGQLILLSHIVNFDYLWKEVRVKGGAYGSRFSIAADEVILMSSYSDPNIENTYNVYSRLSDYLRDFNPSKSLFKTFKIGALSKLDPPLSNQLMINKADTDYLLSFSRKYYKTLKKEIINAKISDISFFSNELDSLKANSSIYTVGNENKIKEYPFEQIDSL